MNERRRRAWKREGSDRKESWIKKQEIEEERQSRWQMESLAMPTDAVSDTKRKEIKVKKRGRGRIKIRQVMGD